MNILLDQLPRSVEVCGSDIPINWGFRASINFSEIILDNSISERDKIIKGAEVYYGDKIYGFNESEAKEAIEKMLWFYTAGQSEKRLENNRREKQTYSFEQDAEYIYAAFLEQYKIELSKASDLHWWEFKAMFASLNDTTQFGKIVGIRSADLSKIDSKEEREYYRRMKKIYALETRYKKEDDELLDAINNALMRGEDISEFLKV